MKDSIFIVVCSTGFVRANKTDNGQLKPGERAFRLDLEIPDEVFRPPQLPVVRMTIPRDALITELDVEAGMQAEIGPNG
jgi:hypothetical protein